MLRRYLRICGETHTGIEKVKREARSRYYKKGDLFCKLCLKKKLQVPKAVADPAYLNNRTDLAQGCRLDLKRADKKGTRRRIRSSRK